MSNQISVKKQLEQIIEDKKIYPVYQPIVSLQNGDILGFEALSRIALKPCTFNVEEMFTYAEEYNCLWNLEYVCHKKALKEIKNKLGDRKLFLNIDPNIFNDERFQAGMTLNYLKRYNISPENICLIAEGIETEEEMIQLIRLGVDYGQGYFLAKPTEKLHGIPDSIRKTIITENKTTTIKQETPSFLEMSAASVSGSAQRPTIQKLSPCSNLCKNSPTLQKSASSITSRKSAVLSHEHLAF